MSILSGGDQTTAPVTLADQTGVRTTSMSNEIEYTALPSLFVIQ